MKIRVIKGDPYYQGDSRLPQTAKEVLAEMLAHDGDLFPAVMKKFEITDVVRSLIILVEDDYLEAPTESEIVVYPRPNRAELSQQGVGHED